MRIRRPRPMGLDHIESLIVVQRTHLSRVSFSWLVLAGQSARCQMPVKSKHLGVCFPAVTLPTSILWKNNPTKF
jgi:hypothetical protein